MLSFLGFIGAAMVTENETERLSSDSSTDLFKQKSNPYSTLKGIPTVAKPVGELGNLIEKIEECPNRQEYLQKLVHQAEEVELRRQAELKRYNELIKRAKADILESKNALRDAAAIILNLNAPVELVDTLNSTNMSEDVLMNLIGLISQADPEIYANRDMVLVFLKAKKESFSGNFNFLGNL